MPSERPASADPRGRIVVTTGLVALAVGALGFLLGRTSVAPAAGQERAAVPIRISSRPYTSSDLIVRTAPWLRAPLVRAIQYGDEATVRCQVIGDRVAVNDLSSTAWYRLAQGGYVNATYSVVLGDRPVPRCPSPTPRPPHRLPAVARAVVQHAGSPLPIRRRPTEGSPLRGSLPDRALVEIVCSTTGSSVTGNWGPSTVWDRLRGGGYVPDGFLLTGSNGPVVQSC